MEVKMDRSCAADLAPWPLMLRTLAGDAPQLVHGSQRGRINVCSNGKLADGDSGFVSPQRAREAGAPSSKELGFAARPARAKQSPNHGQALAQLEQAMQLRPQAGCADA
jgi:hypothetical protein